MRRPVGVKWVLLFFRWTRFFSPAESPLSPPFHPHSSVSDFRSVQVGCSRFSRCCHLIIDLASIYLADGSWARRLTQSTELGFGLLLFLAKKGLALCGQRHRSLLAVPQGFVIFSAHPQTM